MIEFLIGLYIVATLAVFIAYPEPEGRIKNLIRAALWPISAVNIIVYAVYAVYLKISCLWERKEDV